MKADTNRMSYIGAKPGTNKDIRDSDSWFTPSHYVEMAREVMGEIDLDPFSSKAANRHIRAKRYFDVKSNAFEKQWFQDQGRVFMNPPYGRQLVNASVDIFLSNWSEERITQAVVLVNNATETRWFQALLRSSSALCLPSKRIAFETNDGKNVSGNTRGQAFFYFGHRIQKFSDVFGFIGAVLLPVKQNDDEVF